MLSMFGASPDMSCIHWKENCFPLPKRGETPKQISQKQISPFNKLIIYRYGKAEFFVEIIKTTLKPWGSGPIAKRSE